ncbi:MAG: ABC transporter permease [bacterium]|nr:ABC transporter permease [bacterium]
MNRTPNHHAPSLLAPRHMARFIPLDRSHREFFWMLVRRDLKVRYAGSTLGGLWNLIHPLMMIAIYMMIFSSLMPSRFGESRAAVDYGELTYGVHLCAGLIPWLLFSDVLMRSVGVLIENGGFLKKVSFPPIILFTTVLFNSYLVNGAGYLCFIGILLALGKAVPAAALAGLGVMALLGLTAMGLGLILAGLNVFFRDTAQVLTIAMQLLFWFNPIVYDKDLIFGSSTPAAAATADSWLRHAGQTLILINPFERFITASQRLFGMSVSAQNWRDMAILFVFPVVCMAAGLFFFRRMLPDIRDCL